MSKALDELLNGMDAAADTSKRHVRLSTQEERNVRFYQRLGFQVIDEREFAPDNNEKYGFTHWVMVRKWEEPIVFWKWLNVVRVMLRLEWMFE